MTEPDWSPFLVLRDGSHTKSPRSVESIQGIGDRLRAAAFAEIQAREAFLWACQKFDSTPIEIRNSWKRFAEVENEHLHLLLKRMGELQISVHERAVSNKLWISFMSCATDREFAEYMINAEERGRVSGVRFYEALASKDPITAAVVKKIADEEVEHIETVRNFYGLELKPTQR